MNNMISLNQISFLKELIFKHAYLKELFINEIPNELYDISEKQYKRILYLIYNDNILENKHDLINSLDLIGFKRN